MEWYADRKRRPWQGESTGVEMLRIQVVAYGALCLIVALYSEEALNFIHHKTGYLIYPDTSSECHVNPRASDYAWCVVPGYGPSVFRHVEENYYPIDPSAQQSLQDFKDVERTYKSMFGPEPPQH